MPYSRYHSRLTLPLEPSYLIAMDFPPLLWTARHAKGEFRLPCSIVTYTSSPGFPYFLAIDAAMLYPSASEGGCAYTTSTSA